MVKKKHSKLKNKVLNEILTEIVEKKKKDLVRQKKEIPLPKLKEFTSNLGTISGVFKKVILDSNNTAVIAEIKLASPANPDFNPNVYVMDQGKLYENAGADAISYITEKYFFKGEVPKIVEIAAAVKLPILQKDFVIDEYQIYEAKIVGSSALLLIARLVDVVTLKKYVELCKKLGIEPVVEINDGEDLKKAMTTSTNIIAVNARDLSTFEIDLEKAYRLIEEIPEKYTKLGFSGVNSSVEVSKYKKAGARGVLVGTSLMNTKNISDFIKELKTI